MKKKILIGFVVLAIAAVVTINMNLNSQSNDFSDIVLDKTEALADYETGFPGTNWKWYVIECTITTGFDFVVVWTHSYTVTKDACGYGLGTCWMPAGC